MRLTRRAAIVGAAAAGLTACGGVPQPRPASAQVAEQPLPAVPNPGWDAWVAAFRSRAMARGVDGAGYDLALRDAGFIPGVVERDRNQTEFRRSLEDYLAIAASAERIANGRAKLEQWGPVLAEIAARYGVEPHVVTAVWGMESSYGIRRGATGVISSVSTLAYDGRRAAFFEDELVAALRILQNGDITPARMTGSWAGAMGHTQFMPTSYQALAVDFRGDGRRDIWGDDPTDALASTAAYLANAGWRTGAPWGVEVALPPGFDSGLAGRDQRRSVADWAALGVRGMDGGALPDHGAAALILAAGQGPAILAFRNFIAISRYNNAINYVIGVGHLSDRLRGAGPFRTPFGADANGMTQADRITLQRRLAALGYDIGTPDGVIGTRSIAAISAWQAAQGLAVTGVATLDLLAQLR